MTRRQPAPHVRQAIETTTGLPARLSDGRARPGTCPDCAAAVLAGYDHPRCGGWAVADPYRLTPTLDAAALILDRPTWTLHGGPGLYELASRTRPGIPITYRVPPATENIIITNHECGHLLGGESIPLHPPRHHYSDEPPF